MTCQEFIAFIGRFVEGELSAEELRLFQEHLGLCEECEAFLDSYRATMRIESLAFSAPDDPLPESVPEGLVRAVLAANAASRSAE